MDKMELNKIRDDYAEMFASAGWKHFSTTAKERSANLVNAYDSADGEQQLGNIQGMRAVYEWMEHLQDIVMFELDELEKALDPDDEDE